MGKGNIIAMLHVKTETEPGVTFGSEGETDTVFAFCCALLSNIVQHN
jgi:hypothetical protein